MEEKDYVIVVKSGYCIPGVGLVPRMKGLHRDANHRRWKVRPTNDHPCELAHFVDGLLGGPGKAYMKAVEYLYSHGELLKHNTRTVLEEYSTKKVKLGMVGVVLVDSERNGHHYYSVAVGRMADVPAKWFYIGTEDVLEERKMEVLSLAARSRADSVRLFRNKKRVPLSDAMPWAVSIK